uniref:Uncharacterized protein n=1 Tax=Anguilla anguilla TaxID=7936 RepID=A0A0E9WBR9_ANGAN
MVQQQSPTWESNQQPSGYKHRFLHCYAFDLFAHFLLP